MGSYQNIIFKGLSVPVESKVSIGLSTLVVVLVVFLVAPRTVFDSVANVRSFVRLLKIMGKN